MDTGAWWATVHGSQRVGMTEHKHTHTSSEAPSLGCGCSAQTLGYELLQAKTALEDHLHLQVLSCISLLNSDKEPSIALRNNFGKIQYSLQNTLLFEDRITLQKRKKNRLYRIKYQLKNSKEKQSGLSCNIVLHIFIQTHSLQNIQLWSRTSVS